MVRWFCEIGGYNIKTKEEAEEVRDAIIKQAGILKRYLVFEVEQDQYCDGGGYFISIR